MEISSFKIFKSKTASKTRIYFQHINVFMMLLNDNGDDGAYIGDDDYYKIFIADHRFRYSLLYSVLGFFATTLLEPYSKPKKPTRRCLVLTYPPECVL